MGWFNHQLDMGPLKRFHVFPHYLRHDDSWSWGLKWKMSKRLETAPTKINRRDSLCGIWSCQVSRVVSSPLRDFLNREYCGLLVEGTLQILRNCKTPPLPLQWPRYSMYGLFAHIWLILMVNIPYIMVIYTWGTSTKNKNKVDESIKTTSELCVSALDESNSGKTRISKMSPLPSRPVVRWRWLVRSFRSTLKDGKPPKKTVEAENHTFFFEKGTKERFEIFEANLGLTFRWCFFKVCWGFWVYLKVSILLIGPHHKKEIPGHAHKPAEAR